MYASLALVVVFNTLALSTWAHPSIKSRSVLDVCLEIKDAISPASGVFFPGAPSYLKDISHWASSSSELSPCSVEPGTAEDVGIILGILGSTRTPFAVKGSGHATNPGFSSTSGVHIAMYRFSEVTYNADTQTAVIGAGLSWDEVYASLVPQNVNVVGGRLPGVGVAGYSLGGGYSWHSNQYGLTVDNIVTFELVKPDGSIVTVTESSDADLFFALKGGMNNFGIVTRFTLKTFPQGQIWGGVTTFTTLQVDQVTAAVGEWVATVTDPKASMVALYNYVAGVIVVVLITFYDGPTLPPAIFDDFLAIPHLTSDVKTRDFASFVLSIPSDILQGQRVVWSTVPFLELTPSILNAAVNETKFWGSKLSPLASGTYVSYIVEPFLPSILSHSSSPSAYPPKRDKAYLPFDISFGWALSPFDDTMHDSIRQSTKHLENLAVTQGQAGVDTASPYINYAIFDTPVSRIYGDNLGRLQSIKARVDPDNVMGLAGGFKI
ncbi:hypothetical protein AAF712_001788 [Marasmius tenuissimus]|uniref:FAD-binding PCMH-type domain-containing protein n=1 Tax=Marasmius tenuissimus TaxID=585030 RepID=A0ABR3AB73_9AGAR